MIDKLELRAWLDRLGEGSQVGVDEGGLTLVEVDANGNETGEYLEIGGTPLSDGCE